MFLSANTFSGFAVAAAFIVALSNVAVAQQTTATNTMPAMDHAAMGHGAMAQTEQQADLGGHKAGENATIVSSVRPETPLAVGQTSQMVLTLKDKSGAPVKLDELVEMHTEKIHLLIIDPSLGDYHHIHPKAGANPGEYVFPFTPHKSGKYLFYADLVPVKSNAQEYSVSSADVTGTPEQVIKQQQRSATVDGYRFDLEFDNPNLVQGESTRATLKVFGPDGQPFKQLEPVMGAYAHLVAFSENRDHVAHVHPQGKEPESADERGGPELSFYMNITQPGYHMLYSQVQINGEQVYAPFGLQVAPRQIPNTVAGIYAEVDQNMGRLDNVIRAGQLAQVHGLAFWIRDLLLGLEKIEQVPAEAADQLKISLKRIQSYADLLDRYGDAGQAEQTKGVFDRFKNEVEVIRNLVKAPAPKETAAAKPLNNTNCPVSKMPVGSMEPGASLVYNGIEIGLCCSGCKETFNTDPEAYLKKAQESVKK